MVSRTFDFYGQEQFITLNQRLTLSAGITAERSTDNGNINKYYPYPKFSASFRVPQFAGFINELKLRGAWGAFGNGSDLRRAVRERQQPDSRSTTRALTGLFTPESVQRSGDQAGDEHRDRDGLRCDNVLVASAILGHGLPEAHHRSAVPGEHPGRARATRRQWLNGGQFTDRGIEMSLSVTPIQMPKGLRGSSPSPSTGTTASWISCPVPAFSPATSFGPAFGTYWVQQGRPLDGVRQHQSRAATGAPAGRVTSQPRTSMSFGNKFNLGLVPSVRAARLAAWRHVGNLTNAYFDPAACICSRTRWRSQAERGERGRLTGVRRVGTFSSCVRSR